nr:DUF3265 domain-containing protein [Vibrio nigripulchritudo]
MKLTICLGLISNTWHFWFELSLVFTVVSWAL